MTRPFSFPAVGAALTAMATPLPAQAEGWYTAELSAPTSRTACLDRAEAVFAGLGGPSAMEVERTEGSVSLFHGDNGDKDVLILCPPPGDGGARAYLIVHSQRGILRDEPLIAKILQRW